MRLCTSSTHKRQYFGRSLLEHRHYHRPPCLWWSSCAIHFIVIARSRTATRPLYTHLRHLVAQISKATVGGRLLTVLAAYLQRHVRGNVWWTFADRCGCKGTLVIPLQMTTPPRKLHHTPDKSFLPWSGKRPPPPCSVKFVYQAYGGSTRQH